MKHSAFFISSILILALFSGCTSCISPSTANTVSSPRTNSPLPQAWATPDSALTPHSTEPLSIAGIFPGERIENIADQYSLHYVTKSEADEAGLNKNYLYAYSYRYKTYYDGKGLVVQTFADGTIAKVIVFAPGYDTPDGHQAGDAWPYNKNKLTYDFAADEKYGSISYRIYGYGMSSKINKIVMDVFLDRILSEALADLNHNGIDERFVLTGRASTDTFEVSPGTHISHGGVDYLRDDDPATRPRLTVYENDNILWTEELNYYLYGTPEPFPTLTPEHDASNPCFVELCYPTGGSGGDVYYKVLYDDSAATYTTEFWFFGDKDRRE